MNLAKLAVERPIATCTILLLVMVIGIVSLSQASLGLLPDIEPPVLAVITLFPGSAPQETLSLVTEPIEDMASTTSGLTTLYSFSQESLSLIVLQFKWGTNVSALREDIGARLDLLTLPEGVQRPIILEFDPTMMPIMQVSVSGSEDLIALTDQAHEVIAPRLDTVPGIASVSVEGGINQDLFVHLSPRMVEENNLSFSTIVDILRASLLDIPAGIKDIDEHNVRLRFVGKTPDIDLIRNIVVGFNMDEEKLKNIIGKSINIDLNKHLSSMDLPEFKPEDIPMETIYLKDMVEDIHIDKDRNYVSITLAPDQQDDTVSTDTLVDLLPPEWREYLPWEPADDLLPPEELDQGQIIIPIQDDYLKNIDEEQIGNLVVSRVPDYELWMEQIKAGVTRELDHASRKIEDSLAELALTYILTQAGMADQTQMFEGDLPLIPIYLGSIGDIGIAKHPQSTITRINRQPGISLILQKEGDANTVAVAREVRKVLDEIKDEFASDGKEISYAFPLDQGREIEMALKDLGWTLLGGALLAIVILMLFLKNWRTALIIGLSIPTAVIFTFSILYFTKMTINLMTLGGLALSAGMLVDNSIVVSENIYRHFQLGATPRDAAVKGSNEVFGAIFASTLTTICVFFPVVFLSGIAGELFTEFAVTVACALLASLVIALTVVPLLASILLGTGKDMEAAPPRLPFYRRIMDRAIKYRWPVAVGGVLFFLLGVMFYPSLGTDLFPIPEEPSFSIDITLPPGTPMHHTDDYVKEVEQILEQYDQIDSFSARVGDAGFLGMAMESGMTNQARIKVRLNQDSFRDIDNLIARIRKQTAKILPEAELIFTRETLLEASGMEVGLELDIEGESLEKVKDLSAVVAEKLGALPTLTDVKSLMEENRPEIHINIDQEKALENGITTFQIAMAIRQAIQGVTVTNLEIDDNLYSLIVGYKEDELSTTEELEKISVQTMTGSHVRLEDVATLEESFGPLSIPRKNKHIIGQVQAQYRGLDFGTAQDEALNALEEIDIPPGYKIEPSGTAKIMEEAFGELELVFIVAALLVYFVMAAQFESVLYPFIIILSLPLAYTGAILALLITRNSVSVPAMIGAIVLSGVFVNSGIIMVDFINQLRQIHKLPLKEAIVEGAVARLRPILMTTLTTILGLLPLAFGMGQGSQIQAPMAIAIIGGQTGGTLLLLVFIPVLYYLFSRRAEKKETKHSS
ncbi:MAG: efflux RND transporter permease subunit [Firmicutes bacterium]|jgi:HAE1 family hydrophobic/amphiphilic exporter-1|nr:efflux RND transporter permease subunit [Bacillota bacterium]